MPESLQRVEDYYTRKGLKGRELRKALESDRIYQKILSAREKALTKKFSISPKDKKRYMLSTDEDWEILGKIYQLEKKKLSSEDKNFVTFLRTQLEHDWRTPILQTLDDLLWKYEKGVLEKEFLSSIKGRENKII